MGTREVTAVVVGVGAAAVAATLLSFVQPRLGMLTCLRPSMLFSLSGVVRIFTAPFFHAGLLHLLVNALAWWQVAGRLENRLGSLKMFSYFWATVVMTGILHSLVAIAASHYLHTSSAYTCSVGLSSVLFAMFVYEIHILDISRVNVFGIIDTPAHAYPFLLLLIIQILVPHASLLGHLSGIASGYLQCVLPTLISEENYARWEANKSMCNLPGYVPSPAATTLPVTRSEGGENNALSRLMQLVNPRAADETEEPAAVGDRAVNVAEKSRLVHDG